MPNDQIKNIDISVETSFTGKGLKEATSAVDEFKKRNFYKKSNNFISQRLKKTG